MYELNFDKIKLPKITKKLDKEAPCWDLSFLYKNIEDKKIFKDLEEASKTTKDFKIKYKDKINPLNLSFNDLKLAITEYEKILSQLITPVWYLELVHSIDTQDSKLLAILGKAENIYSTAMQELNFFENSLSKLDLKTQEAILNTKELTLYKNFFRNLFAGSMYTLDNKLEELIIEKDLNGRNNWQKFRQIYESHFSFSFTEDKGEKEYTLSELATIARRHNDPKLREKASNTVLKKFKENDYVFSFIYNTLIQDYIATNIKRRGYKTPIEKRNIQNQLSNTVVDNLINSVEQNYILAQQYWKKKAKLVGLKKLKSCDIYAPYPHSNNKKYNFIEAYEIIIEAVNDFSPKIRKLLEILFKYGLIDAKPQKGKRSGAYCAMLTPPLASVVFSNFMGTYNDITTIMHEAGHWLHHMLISNNQSLLNTNTPLTTAETASVFFEMILFEKTLEKLEREANKGAIVSHIMGKIDDILATAFRQIAFTKFEIEVYKKALVGPLQTKDFEEIFVKEYGKLFGDAVDMTEYFRYEWSYIPHFINSPFYVYSYAFGELATIGLYNKYKESDDKNEFIEKYLEFLASGSRLSPYELYLTMGIDIESKELWQNTFSYIEHLMSRL